MHLDDEAVLLNLVDKSYVSLNATAAYIWKALDEGRDREWILRGLVETFGATPVEASAAVTRLLSELRERGLVDGALTADDSGT